MFFIHFQYEKKVEDLQKNYLNPNKEQRSTFRENLPLHLNLTACQKCTEISAGKCELFLLYPADHVLKPQDIKQLIKAGIIYREENNQYIT